MAPMEPASPRLIYDSTLTLFRLSPLHFPASTPLLSPASLKTHARRLGDALKGDVLRGIRVALDGPDEGTARSGGLLTCRWTQVGQEQPSEPTDSSDPEPAFQGADGFGFTEGIHVELAYENSSYFAWLLRLRQTSSDNTSSSIHLPLLCVRMPNPIKEMFLTYLSSAFDTRVDALHIPSFELARSLESYVAACRQVSTHALYRLVKDVQLTLAFKAPVAPSLRSMDITITKDDLGRMVKEGERVSEAPSGMSAAQKGVRASGPFFRAIAKYLEAHLALDLSNQEVLLGRVACAAFGLGKEGKVKLFSPHFESGDERVDAASKDATKCILDSLFAMAGHQSSSAVVT